MEDDNNTASKLMNDEIKILIRGCNELLNDEFFTLNNIDITRHELTLLLDYITNLQQENERLKEENKYLDELRNANYLSWQDSLSRIEKTKDQMQLIRDLGFDYDGYNDVENLKLLIDELVRIAGKSIDILNVGSDE